MRVASVKNYFPGLYFRKNTKQNVECKPSCALNLNNLPNYPVAFGAKSNSEKLCYIGEENFPNQTILDEYKASIEAGDSELLCQIHKNYYASLLTCKTLDEAKQKYPEFKDVKDAKDIEKEEQRGALLKIAKGEVEGANIENLSLVLLQKHYANAMGHAKSESYFNLTAKTVLFLFENLNIKPLNREYFLTITRETPERRAVCSSNALKLWEDTTYRKGRSEDAKKRWQREDYRQMRTDSLQKQWQDPKKREQQAEAMRKMHEQEGFEEKRIASIKRNWQDPKKREELTEINKRNLAARWRDPKEREKMSKRMKEKWQDPIYREKICSGISERMIERWKDPLYIEFKTEEKRKQWQDPNFRQHMSQTMKEKWQDPAYREKMAIYSEALALAWEIHSDFAEKMSEIAKEFKGLGRIFTKVSKKEPLSEIESKTLNAYYKRCHEEMPDYTKIVGQTQKEILAEWEKQGIIANWQECLAG